MIWFVELSQSLNKMHPMMFANISEIIVMELYIKTGEKSYDAFNLILNIGINNRAQCT